MTAARAWAAGSLTAASPGLEPEAIADARRWGAGAAELDAMRGHLHAGPAQPAVWITNAQIVSAFVCAATQWRTGLDVSNGRARMIWIGLDYAGARISIEASGIPITPALWDGLRVMEAAARDALNGETMH